MHPHRWTGQLQHMRHDTRDEEPATVYCPWVCHEVTLTREPNLVTCNGCAREWRACRIPTCLEPACPIPEPNLCRFHI